MRLAERIKRAKQRSALTLSSELDADRAQNLKRRLTGVARCSRCAAQVTDVGAFFETCCEVRDA